MKNSLIDKTNNYTACIGIVGLGYVGLPLAIAFSKKFNTIGYDVYDKCIANLLSGKSHILDVLASTQNLGKSFFLTKNPEDLKKCDFLIVCVPTSLSEQKENEECAEVAALLYGYVINKIVGANPNLTEAYIV